MDKRDSRRSPKSRHNRDDHNNRREFREPYKSNDHKKYHDRNYDRDRSYDGENRNRRQNRRLDKPVLLQDDDVDDNTNTSSRDGRRNNRRLDNPVVFPKDFKWEDNDEIPDSNRGHNSHGGMNEQIPDVEPVGFKNYGKKQEKTKADFGLSGKLAEDTNMFNGIVVKYSEPADAKKPNDYWRLYPFKGKEALPVLHIHRQSGFLIGRERKVADIPMDHPSISKQHAVRGQTRLYVIDLESGNGTYLNNKRIDAKRYYELKETDVIKFGYSSREYVVMTNETEILD